MNRERIKEPLHFSTSRELAESGCRSLKLVVATGGAFTAQVAEFLGQSDECVFRMGACHVMAATLFEELRARKLAVDVFRVAKGQDMVASHYVVGYSDRGPFLDVSLKWQTLAEIDAYFEGQMVITGPVPPNPPVTAWRLAAWATPNGQSRGTPPSRWPFCADELFLSEAGTRAAAFLRRNGNQLDALMSAHHGC